MKNLNLLMVDALSESFISPNGDIVTLADKSGMELDFALVEFEQTKVEEFIKQYTIDNPKVDMSQVIKTVNESFVVELFWFIPVGYDQIRNVMKEHFTDSDGNNTFNFGNYNDRVKLGQELKRNLHEAEKITNEYFGKDD